jgi:TrwC relaxase
VKPDTVSATTVSPTTVSRVHNPRTREKDLVRLPGLVAIAYQHETSRCGDPHLDAHVIVPNRQARDDGQMASIDREVAVSRSQGGRGHLPGQPKAAAAKQPAVPKPAPS